MNIQLLAHAPLTIITSHVKYVEYFMRGHEEFYIYLKTTFSNEALCFMHNLPWYKYSISVLNNRKILWYLLSKLISSIFCIVSFYYFSWRPMHKLLRNFQTVAEHCKCSDKGTSDACEVSPPLFWKVIVVLVCTTLYRSKRLFNSFGSQEKSK